MKRSSVTCVSSVIHEGLWNYVNSTSTTQKKSQSVSDFSPSKTFLPWVWREPSLLHKIKFCACLLMQEIFALQIKFLCMCASVCVCLCCSSPANSNSSVASEQEERGSLKTKYRAYITNSSVHPRTPSPCYKHTSPSSPSSFPPTPTGRAHPSSSSPPIATAHLSSPPLFLDQQIASVPPSPPSFICSLSPCHLLFALIISPSLTPTPFQAVLQTLQTAGVRTRNIN